MMRRLVLMRHAKAVHHSQGSDHARGLTQSGRSDARAAGLALRRMDLQLALVSTSTRTRETFEALGLDIPAMYLDDLYFGGTHAALNAIAVTDDSVTGLIVVGHAPTIPDLAARLLHSGNPREADQVGSWFPTAAYSSFELPGPWSDLLGEPVTEYDGTTRPATRP